MEVFLFPPVPLHLAQSGSRSRLVAHVGVVRGVWRVKSPRVIRSQVETRSLARECDESEMRTTRRCSIQSSHWAASRYRLTIIITRSHAPGQVLWYSDDVDSLCVTCLLKVTSLILTLHEIIAGRKSKLSVIFNQNQLTNKFQILYKWLNHSKHKRHSFINLKPHLPVLRGKFLKICWPAVSPGRGCQVTCGGGGEIINMGSHGSTPAVVNRQQSSQHPSRRDADSQDDQTSLENDQEQAPPAQEGGH